MIHGAPNLVMTSHIVQTLVGAGPPPTVPPPTAQRPAAPPTAAATATAAAQAPKPAQAPIVVKLAGNPPSATTANTAANGGAPKAATAAGGTNGGVTPAAAGAGGEVVEVPRHADPLSTQPSLAEGGTAPVGGADEEEAALGGGDGCVLRAGSNQHGFLVGQ